MAKKTRSDADRRSRQCAKFARLIRIARLVLGNGRWGPAALAREIECSERTIFRDIEILSAAGIPIFFDKSVEAYRVTDGFRFGGLEPERVEPTDPSSPALHDLLTNARRLLAECETFVTRLRSLCTQLETASPNA
jgi:predicted DNA-binding transcriptional regulator YafY